MLSPLVLLPGTGCNARLWGKILPKLSGIVNPVLPDLLSCSTQAGMLEELAALPYDKFDLLGFSMGGYLAQRFFLKNPHRVSKLALICTSGAAKKTSPEMIKQYCSKLLTSDYLSNMINIELSEFQRLALLEQLKVMLTEVGISSIESQMMATRLRPDSLSFFKPPFPSRTLVIGGTKDKLVSESEIKALAKAFQTEAKWVECGHMLPLEAPDTFVQHIYNWLIMDETVGLMKTPSRA